MHKALNGLIQATREEQLQESSKPLDDVIKVSETVSAAAKTYENIRNTLEYSEEHLLRRNAIRRFLKRRMSDEQDYKELASDLLRELIWARYLPNKRVPEQKIEEVQHIFEKYEALFEKAHTLSNSQTAYQWLLDVLGTEIEYRISSHTKDEALVSFAYKQLLERMTWQSNLIPAQERELQLYIALHKAILKSNLPTLRFRVLSLYYPEWLTASAGSPVVSEIANNLNVVIGSVEAQLRHRGSDRLYRLMRREAVPFRIMQDLIEDDADAFSHVVQSGAVEDLDGAIKKAAGARYETFHKKLRRSVSRAVLFLFFTKFVFAFAVEYPYEAFILKEKHYVPLMVNILFHPIILGIIGLSVRIPEEKNTSVIQSKLKAILGLDEDFSIVYKGPSLKSKKRKVVFNVLYAIAFIFTIGFIATFLASVHFNIVSIILFLFFFSLVLFMGFRVRYTKRELLAIDQSDGFLGTVLDIIFLPVIRLGRWITLHASRINVFLFFFDFIIEAPFKAAVAVIEGWLSFLKEKKDEI